MPATVWVLVMKNNIPARGLRNNNPLNIIKSKTVRWLGETNCESERIFCTFSSMTFGLRAALKLLRTYYQRHGCVTAQGGSRGRNILRL